MDGVHFTFLKFYILVKCIEIIESIGISPMVDWMKVLRGIIPLALIENSTLNVQKHQLSPYVRF